MKQVHPCKINLEVEIRIGFTTKRRRREKTASLQVPNEWALWFRKEGTHFFVAMLLLTCHESLQLSWITKRCNV